MKYLMRLLQGKSELLKDILSLIDIYITLKFDMNLIIVMNLPNMVFFLLSLYLMILLMRKSFGILISLESE